MLEKLAEVVQDIELANDVNDEDKRNIYLLVEMIEYLLRARQNRLKGLTAVAIRHEKKVEQRYKQLPKELRW